MTLLAPESCASKGVTETAILAADDAGILRMCRKRVCASVYLRVSRHSGRRRRHKDLYVVAGVWCGLGFLWGVLILVLGCEYGSVGGVILGFGGLGFGENRVRV